MTQYYIDHHSSTLPNRSKSESRTEYVQKHISPDLNDNSGVSMRRPPPDSRFSTLRSDGSDWQFFGPDEVPSQRQPMSLRSMPESPTLRSTQSEYYAPASKRTVIRSSASDYYGPTSTSKTIRRMSVPNHPNLETTKTLKIVRKGSAVPVNGFSAPNEVEDGYLISSHSMPHNKSSTVKRTIKKTVTRRRDSSPAAVTESVMEPARIVVQEVEKPPERISVFVEETNKSTGGRSLSIGREVQEQRTTLDRSPRAPGKIHTIQTVTTQTSSGGDSTLLLEKTGTRQTRSQPLDKVEKTTTQVAMQPLQVATLKRMETVMQQIPQPVLNGNSTLKRTETVLQQAAPLQVVRDETYVNKVFQTNENPQPKPTESFKSGVVLTEEKPKVADIHITRINLLNSVAPPTEHVTHTTTISLQQSAPPVQPHSESEFVPMYSNPSYESTPQRKAPYESSPFQSYNQNELQQNPVNQPSYNVPVWKPEKIPDRAPTQPNAATREPVRKPAKVPSQPEAPKTFHKQLFQQHKHLKTRTSKSDRHNPKEETSSYPHSQPKRERALSPRPPVVTVEEVTYDEETDSTEASEDSNAPDAQGKPRSEDHPNSEDEPDTTRRPVGDDYSDTDSVDEHVIRQVRQSRRIRFDLENLKPAEIEPIRREPVQPVQSAPHHTPLDQRVYQTKQQQTETEGPKVKPKNQDQVDHAPKQKPEKPKKRSKPKTTTDDITEEYLEEIFLRAPQLAAPPQPQPETETEDEEESHKKTTKKVTKIVRVIEQPLQQLPVEAPKKEKKVKPKADELHEDEEISETTIQRFYKDMTPERQKTFSELTKTALGRTEQTASNIFGNNKSLITEAWHTNRPKTEQEIIEEISRKTTSDVVKKSLLDGLDYKYIPTHSKELEEIQRKRREFEAEMERQRKIRDIRAGIRQSIHVDHNEEDLVGDYQMSVTDDGQIDMDTIEEHVDLGISENGVAAIAVKVTAERILPVDMENRLWRKSSVTVTRTIEIDLMRCQETRQLYERILNAHKAALQARAEESARLGLPAQSTQTHKLDATDTYKIFSALMNATGEGDTEELGILGGEAAKAFLSGNYIRNAQEKEKAFSNNLRKVETKTTVVKTASHPGRQSNQFSELTLDSIRPEVVRNERYSEYYKQKMRPQSPVPEFPVQRMFNGRQMAPLTTEEFNEETHTVFNQAPARQQVREETRTVHQQAPVRHELREETQTVHKQVPVRHNVREERTESPHHAPERYEIRKEVQTVNSQVPVISRQDIREEQYFRRNHASAPAGHDSSMNCHIEHHESRLSGYRSPDSSASLPLNNAKLGSPGEGVFFSQRVQGVKQTAKNNKEAIYSQRSQRASQEAEHLPNAETAHYTLMQETRLRDRSLDRDGSDRSTAQKTMNQNDRLYGGDDLITKSHQEWHEETRAQKLSEAQNNGDGRTQLSGINTVAQNELYVDGRTGRGDINNMLKDAESYFRKTAGEYELEKLNKGASTNKQFVESYDLPQRSYKDIEMRMSYDEPDRVQESRSEVRIVRSSDNAQHSATLPRSQDVGTYDELSGRFNQKAMIRNLQNRSSSQQDLLDMKDRNSWFEEESRAGYRQPERYYSDEDIARPGNRYFSEGGLSPLRTSNGIRHNERRVERAEELIRASPEELFDVEDTYFNNGTEHRKTSKQVIANRVVGGVEPSGERFGFKDIPHRPSPTSANQYLNVRKRRAELQQEINDKGSEPTAALDDTRRRMLGQSAGGGYSTARTSRMSSRSGSQFSRR